MHLLTLQHSLWILSKIVHAVAQNQRLRPLYNYTLVAASLAISLWLFQMGQNMLILHLPESKYVEQGAAQCPSLMGYINNQHNSPRHTKQSFSTRDKMAFVCLSSFLPLFLHDIPLPWPHTHPVTQSDLLYCTLTVQAPTHSRRCGKPEVTFSSIPQEWATPACSSWFWNFKLYWLQILEGHELLLLDLTSRLLFD